MLGLFLLGSGLLMMTQLFDTSLRHTLSIERRYQLGQFADEVVDSLREWASNPAHFSSSWTPYDNDDFVDARFPGLTVHVESRKGGVSLQSPFFGAPQSRVIPDSLVEVSVDAYLAERPKGPHVKLQTYVAEPVPMGLLGASPPSLSVTLTAGTDPLPGGQRMEFEAALLDESGSKIKGVVFAWEVLPEGPAPFGNGMVESLTYEGDRAALIHRYPKIPTGFVEVPGRVKVQARARYGGREILGESSVIELQ